MPSQGPDDAGECGEGIGSGKLRDELVTVIATPTSGAAPTPIVRTVVVTPTPGATPKPIIQTSLQGLTHNLGIHLLLHHHCRVCVSSHEDGGVVDHYS